jgi:uncharacterized protein
MVATTRSMENDSASKRKLTRQEIFKRILKLGGFAVVVEIICLYVVLCPLLWMPMFNQVLFQPDKTEYDMKTVNQQFQSMFHVHREDLMFDGPRGTKLSGSYFELPGNDKVVLISHGNGGNIAHRIPAVVNLLQAGYSVFVYDYEGYGKSTGSPSMKNVCEDGFAAFDYLVKQRHVLANNIILFGESLGSAVSCHLLTQRSCGGVIIQSGFDTLYNVGREKLVWLNFYPQIIMPEPRFNNLEVLSKPHPPLLIIHGVKDQIVPFSHGEKLMSAAVEPKKFVRLPNADHNDIYTTDRDISTKALTEFRKTLGN